MTTHFFISFEGIEGVGKSTLVQVIAKYLASRQIAFRLTREPGGTPLAEQLRALLLSHHDEQVTPQTELLLMFAARAQHVANVIKPSLALGEWVLCDRFTDASFAYQGAGRGVNVSLIEELARFCQQDCGPDLTFLLVAPVNIALQRASKRAVLDRFEQEQVAFFERVQQNYLERALLEPDRFCVIDASLPLAEVHALAIAAIHKRLQH